MGVTEFAGSLGRSVRACQSQSLTDRRRAHDGQSRHRPAHADVEQRVAHVLGERHEDHVVGFEALGAVNGLARDVALVGRLPRRESERLPEVITDRPGRREDEQVLRIAIVVVHELVDRVADRVGGCIEIGGLDTS